MKISCKIEAATHSTFTQKINKTLTVLQRLEPKMVWENYSSPKSVVYEIFQNLNSFSQSY
jgi:hypothetical protein